MEKNVNISVNTQKIKKGKLLRHEKTCKHLLFTSLLS